MIGFQNMSYFRGTAVKAYTENFNHSLGYKVSAGLNIDSSQCYDIVDYIY